MKALNLLFLIALLAQPVLAQTLIPATSEDINEFDRQVSEQLSKNQKSKSNFGTSVSEEAKKLNEAPTDSKKEFGKWVSSQRKKNDQGRPAIQGSANSGTGSSNRGHSESARENAPGQKKKDK